MEEVIQDSALQKPKENPLGTEKIWKLILKFAVPTVIVLLINNLYSMVDQIFIGQGVNSNAVGGTTVLAPITTASIALSSLVGDGLATYFGLKLGEKQPERCAKAVGNGLILGAILSVIITVPVLCCLGPICNLIGGTKENLPYAIDYGMIVVCGFPLVILGTVINASIRVDGSPQYAMISMIVGAVLNMGLDPLFIYVLHMGVKGAAWATVISQAINLVLNVIYMFRYKTIKLKLTCFKPEFRLWGRLLVYGFASFINTLAGTVVGIITNTLLTKFGALPPADGGIGDANIPLNTFGPCLKVSLLFMSVSMGISAGIQPILGYNYGAGKNDRIKSTFLLAVLFTTIWQILSFIIFMSCPQYLIKIFGEGDKNNPELYEEFATNCFRIYLGASLINGVQLCASTLFQSIGKPVIATVISLTKNVIFLIPFMFIFAYSFGVYGVLWGGFAADICAFFMSGICVIISMKKFLATSPTLAETVQDAAAEISNPAEQTEQ